MNITMIGSCFCGFLKKPLAHLNNLQYPEASELNFQTATIWQRIDAVSDILNNNIPDHGLIKYYIDNGYWENKRPLGIEVEQEIRDSKWFANRILEENRKALNLVNDTPDLLIFDSLSDWRHPLYRHRIKEWKCFLGKIHFSQEEIARRFNAEFEFIQLLDLKDINPHLKGIISYYKSRNNNLRTIYIHFPALAGYLEKKWVVRAEQLNEEVALLQKELGKDDFYQMIIPQNIVKPLTDPSNPYYSKDVWSHFHEDVYEFCSNKILNWL